MDADVIVATLEEVAERVGDPAPQIYARLFAAQPEMEAQFARDRDGTIKGAMLQHVIDVILDLCGPRAYARNMVACEVHNHEGMEVPHQVFATFFGVVRDTFREILGDDWTPAHETAWGELVSECEAIAAESALSSVA